MSRKRARPCCSRPPRPTNLAADRAAAPPRWHSIAARASTVPPTDRAVTIRQLATALAGRARVAKLNLDENPATANRFGVRSIPTLLVLKGGREVDRIVGVQPKSEIARRVGRAIA